MHKFCHLLATGFYVGHLRPPGTLGSLLAIVLIMLTFYLGILGKFFVFVALFVIGIIVSEYYEKYHNERDASQIVIDEIVGYYFVLMFVSFNMINLLITFFLFRIFDIAKPYPIKQVESIEGGTGVMIDDLIAGIYSLGIFHIIKVFI